MASGRDEMIGGAVRGNVFASRNDVVQQGSTHENAENANNSRNGRTQQVQSAILPPKRRGRPPKAKPSVTAPTTSTPAIGITGLTFKETPNGIPQPPPKRRGRPRKDKSAIVDVSARLAGEAILGPTLGGAPEGTPKMPLTPPSRLRRRRRPSNASSPLANSSSAHLAYTSPVHIFNSSLAIPDAILAISSPNFQASGNDIELAAKTTLTATSSSRDPSYEISSLAPAPTLTSPSKDLQRTTTRTPTETPELTNVDIVAEETKIRKKYDTAKKAVFTSHDQLQRSAGVPGIYFDLPGIYHRREGTVGRPKKQMIALFKSEKLKSLPWMRSMDVLGAPTGNLPSAANRVETLVVNGITENVNEISGLALKRKRDEVFENSTSSPNPKRTLLEVVQNFGGTSWASYKSPYQSSLSVSSYQQEIQPSISLASQVGTLVNSMSTTFPEHQCDSPFPAGESPSLGSLLHNPTTTENHWTQTFEDGVLPTATLDEHPTTEDSQILQDEQLQIAIQAVANIEFPDVACMLPASKDGVAGNLCLSADKKILRFVLGEHQVDNLAWSIQITEITSPPQISRPGFLPIELHFNTRDESETKIVQCFTCLDTEHGYQTANNMRAKIVTAMTILGLWDVHVADDALTWEDPERPFKCEVCGGVWKNQGGLVYHQTKSKTSCNPNYMPYIQGPRRKRARSSLDQKNTVDDCVRDIFTPLKESAIMVDHNGSHVVPTIEVERVGMATSNALVSEITSLSAALGRPDLETTSTPKLASADGTVESLQLDVSKRKEIIMELFDANGNVFPANKSLWFSYISVWLRKFPKFALPSYSSFNAAVELLVDTGHIRNVVFSFRDKLGLMVSRTVVAGKGVDLISPQFTQLKEKIKEAYPEYYIPPDFALPKAVRSMLEDREKRQHTERSAATCSPKVSQAGLHSSEQRPDTFNIPFVPVGSSPGKITRSGRVSKAPQRLHLVEENLQFQSGLDQYPARIGLYDEDEYSFDEESPRKIASPEKTRSVGATNLLVGRPRKTRVEKFNEKVKRANTIINNENPGIYDDENYGLSNSDSSQESFQERRSHAAVQSREDIEQCRRRLSGLKTIPKARVRPEFWQPALTYLQTESGAWASSTQPRKRTKYTFKQRMPEPVTYMQTLTNSAWNIRPFGHGVRPIHARPSRRVEGNPTAELYDEKVQNGFRPVLMPSRRKFGPALPSKNISLLSPIRGKKRRLSSALPRMETEHVDHRRKRRVKRPELQKTSPISLPQGSIQESRQTSMVSDIDSYVLNTGEKVWEDFLVSDCGPSSDVEQSLRSRSSRTVQFKSIPVNPEIDPLPHSLKNRNGHETLISLAASNKRNFLNNSAESSGVAETQHSNTVYMNRSNTFLRRTYSPAPAELQWQEDDQEEVGDDQDYTLPEASTEVMLGQSQGSRQLTQRMMKTRRLTALPADVEGIIDPNTGDSDFAVEIAYEHQRNLGLRKRIKLGSLNVEVENRIMLAVVIVRTLTGGLDKSIDWVLVSKMFQDFPMNFISKRWVEMQQKHKTTIEKLNSSFQEWFLEVYERGEIPAINYDHLLDYDWENLVDLAGKELRMSVNKEIPKLPATFGEVNEMYTVKKTEDHRPWRDDFFGLLQPVYKRMENAASEQYTIPISIDMPSNSFCVDHLTVAKSWARASILTPAGIYDPTFATEKLGQLNHGQVKRATDALLASKVLMQRNKGRATPGRGYEITDTFAAAFRKHLDEKQLTQAVAYKTFLDDALRANQPTFVEWTANEGHILAITNMQANNRVRLEPRDVPNNKFGLTGGDYQTKRMDKAKLRFNMQIIPTETYLYDADIPILSKYTGSVKSTEPPRSVAHAIPLWYDISENLMPAMWRKVLCTVLGLIALRPGVDVKELVRLFSPALEEWELRLLLDWGVRVGALTVLREGYEGWNVGEWWWVIGGKA